jgi:hypothetical protein
MVDRPGSRGEGSAGNPSRTPSDAPAIDTNITNKTLIYSSVVCFFAWVLSV